MGFIDKLKSYAAELAKSVAEEPVRMHDDVSGESDTGRTRWYTDHDGGYYVCSHSGCKKKADPFITDHDCCGRRERGRKCKQESMERYDGPGTFAHRAQPPTDIGIEIGTQTPGLCTICNEPLDAHEEFN